ncbi:hypothetical protein B0H14DRAFT_3891158 [Mycena olivaceomarginata]|nr:hypothetical protein B0H14DRAFT_3891158 [Mycena olivaceomarginata]
MRSFFSTLPSALVVAALASISLIYAAQRSGCSASHQRTPYDFGLGSPLLAPCRRRTFALLPIIQRPDTNRRTSYVPPAAITCTIRTNGTHCYPFIHRHRRIPYQHSSLRKMACVLAATFLYLSSSPGHTDLRETNAIPQP